MKICECGQCGLPVKDGNKYINGHNFRGKHLSEETKNKIRISNIRKPHKKSTKKIMIFIIEV